MKRTKKLRKSAVMYMLKEGLDGFKHMGMFPLYYKQPAMDYDYKKVRITIEEI